MKHVWSGRRQQLLAMLLVLAMLWPIIGLTSPLRLGDFTFAYPPAKSLSIPTHLHDGLQSWHFCNSVGGVAFGGIASGVDGLQADSLTYDRHKPDGERLQVTLVDAKGKRQEVTAQIYDWQLVPIARYALDDQHSCFTLFGELENPRDMQARLKRREKILNYHPAFADTLLGLRLFQADILILFQQSCDLPKDDDRYILGAGEVDPDVKANQHALTQLHQVLDDLEGGPFQSYVIGDDGVKISFSADAEARLVLTGDPIWHCWKSRTSNRKQIDQIQAEANAEGNRILNAAFQRDARLLSREELQQKYSASYLRELHHIEFDRVISSKLLAPMPKFSQMLSAEISGQGGINPAVYDSLVTTMRYAAFFRAFKLSDNVGYAAFVETLAGVQFSPKVVTPTVLIGAR